MFRVNPFRVNNLLRTSFRTFTVQNEYTTSTVGEGFDKRIFLHKNEKKISPWHDLPLFRENSKKSTFLGYFEISHLNIAKLEISANEPYNPVKQDTNKSRHTGELQLRYYAKFPIFNYGILPQTWEHSTIMDGNTSYMGDNDPIDILELGTKPLVTGTVAEVQVLGALCLIDQNELDWKILTLNTEEAEGLGIRDHKDYEEAFPYKLNIIKEGFRSIKTYDGKQADRFGHNEEILSVDETIDIIEENHRSYKQLIDGQIENKYGFWLP